ncbi:Uncharacterised protein [Legionella beliardensis]|uniref:Uncharacterized protein n=1 Tax=Legionella beliardensis TaxID=91822 RepID=A0A378I0W3_9GAMM|nr:outer membrane beta-barrel protein [Legionella beliardensis]STX28305.1 Uncharacterised protein [Legionella beliardensis]
MNNKKISLLSLLLICQSSLSVIAGTMGETKDKYYHPFINVGIGAAWQKIGSPQTVTLLPPDSNYYTVKSDYKLATNFNFAVGFEQLINQHFSYQLGIAAYGNTAVNSRGHVWQFALPEFDNFSYRYKIQSTAFLLTGKLLSDYSSIIHPYLSANIGLGLNRSFSYEETPLIEEAVAMEPFRNHTSNSFAWGAGTGLEINITPTTRFGIGYQFIDFGNATLGKSPVQVGSDTLKQKQLSHQMAFQITLFA